MNAVLASKVGRAGQYALLVLEVALGHGDRRGGRGVERRTGLQQIDDFAAAVAGPVDDLVQAFLGKPFHFDQVGQRNARDRGIACQRHHAVAVAAEDERRHVLDRDVHFIGEKITEPRGVEYARHADDLVGRQAAGIAQHADHDIQRIGDADHEGIGAVLPDAGADLTHDIGIDADQIVAAHAGLAGHTGGNDHHLCAANAGIGIGAGQFGVETLHRRAFGEIERLALRDAFYDVEKNDIAQLLEARQMRQRAADIARADQRDLVSRHEISSCPGLDLAVPIAVFQRPPNAGNSAGGSAI